MKKFLSLFLIVILAQASLTAQTVNVEARETNRQTEIPGACSDRTCVNLKDGNGTLGQIYAVSACGLNYVQVSRKVTTRYAMPAGSSLPVILNVSGIPACFQIEQAYLWWTFAGTQNTSTATVTNPGGATQTFNATLSGSGPAKCWSEGGTRLFRADVTSHITGNGNYNVNLNTSVWGTDGITLFIVYRDLSATYTGNIYINDGLRVQGGGSQTQALTFPAACQAGTNGRAFSVVSDMQDNVGATHQATHNGVTGTFPSNFYNFDQTNVTINSGQSTSNFGYNKGSDCWAWSMMGLYFQTNCVTCTPASGTPAVASVSQTNICSGQSVTASLTPVPSSMQWQSAPSSTGPWTNIAGATSSPYNSGALNNNICYRAFYPSACGTDTSNIVCVTISGLSTAPTGATASPSTICSAQPVTLTVQGGSLAAGATWEWYSGSCGGTPVGSGATITVTPSATTTYFVRAVGPCNTTACASVTVTIANAPTVQFSNSTPCFPNATLFSDNSVANSTGGITSWNWNFGNGNTSTLQNPSHTYTSVGTYNVTLTVTNSNGCSDSITQIVTINPKPSASFTFTNQCNGTAIPFNSTSTISSGTITNYSWNFGNSNTGSGASTSHLYGAPGTYNVTHIVTGSNSCSDTITQAVTVYSNPTASFTHQNVCLGSPMNFTNTSTVNAPDVISGYVWVFGDGSPTSTLTNPSHTYSTAGTYTVTLIANSSNTCSGVATATVTVYNPPVANFTFNNACPNAPVQFTNTSTTPGGGSIGSFAWNFGDGSPINTSSLNPVYSYSTAGAYLVTLIVSSNNNCIDTVTLPVTVNPNPIVDFTADNLAGCTPHCTNFTSLSNILSGNIASYEWNFGDGNQSNSQNPSHCFINESLSPKYFNITLKATSDNGCVTTLTKSNYITAYPLPIADFSSDPNPTDLFRPTVQFTDLSLGATSWLWNFGDNTFNPDTIIQNPVHTYNDSGIYNVWLNIENVYGCTDSIAKPVNIRPNFALFIPNAFTPNGDSYNTTFAAKGFGIKEYTMYVFNRWGELIYTANDIDKGWDGTLNGADCQQDLYVYRIDVVDINLKKHQYRGSVSLIR